MKFLFISLLLFIYSLSFAQIQWQENGVPVRQGENIKWNGTTVTCDDGNLVCIWSDTRNGDSGIFAQKMSPDGVLFWGEEGIEVNDAEKVQDSPVATSGDNNFVIVAWKNFQDWDNMEVRAQKIDANGDLLWDSEGILLGFYNEIEAKIYIVNDGADGALIFWEDNSFTPSSLYGIHILGDGSIAPGWEVNGNQIVPSLPSLPFSHYLNIIADGYGGAVLSWTDYNDLYMQRVDGSGNLLWGTNGTILCEDTQWNVTISTDNNGIFYFFWIDPRNYPQWSIYMQKVDQNGNILWVEDELIHQNSSLSRIKSVIGNDGYPIICWISGEHIYAQKIDINGNILWDPTGLPICINNDCGNFNLITDNYDGCWITWKMGIAPYPDIYIQHVNSNGTILLEENGMLICSAENYQGKPSINTSFNDEIYISWEDWRTCSASLYSQIVNFDGIIQLPENGTEIFEGLSGETHNLKILSNGDNPFLIWKDRRYGNDSQIYIQSLNSDGSTVFEEDGIPVTPLFSSNQENFDANIPLDSNEIAIVWESIDAGFKQIYTQAIDFDGNYLWSNSNGLIVGQFPAEQQIPKISSVNNSGIYEYYIGWEDFTDFMESQIKGQKVINGELQWGDEGITIADRTGNDELSCLAERFYIWRNIVYPNYSVYAKLVDEDGNTAPGWDENGNCICEIQEIPYYKINGLITPLGLLIIWIDERNGNNNIYGQVITPDGTILWQENGLPLVTQENDQYGFKFVYDDGLYITWSDFRSGSYSEIYIQKYDEFGNELWQEGGILIAGGDDLYTSSPDVVKVGDKILVVWEENNDYFLDIKAQLLNENGELLWNPQGLVICDEFRDQSYPQVVSNGDNDTFIAWLDNRAIYLSGGFEEIQGVYAQKVYIEPTSVENEIVPKTTKLFPNFPNPFNPETTIYFTAENAETCPPWRIVIYNIKGQKVKTYSFPSGSCRMGTRSVVWNGTDKYNKPVSSGVYFYSLKIDNKIFETKKCLLLK